MADWRLATPVGFIVFNRPDTTERVLKEIARAKPPKLLVVADGPRMNRLGEDEKCARTRALIDRIDWDCEVLTNFAPANMGCRNRVSSGVNWIFENVSEAIILEDDCLPDPSFFRFCEELLERYRDDERISQICGANFQFGRKRTDASYYFSRYNHIWGWASWRRAWRHYDRDAAIWPRVRQGNWLDHLVGSSEEKRHWEHAFEGVYQSRIDTWDYQWMLASWAQGMMSIVPNKNLITNIGFGADATHTKSASPYSAISSEAVSFPLVHPEIFLPHGEADAFTAKGMFTNSIPRRVIQRLKALVAT